MAGRTKTVPLSKTKNIRQRLATLYCPFIDGLDDIVIHELLLSPGDARLRLLEWLIARVHPQLRDALVPSSKAKESKVDKLTSLVSEVGLCTAADTDLVKGATATWRQIQFLDALTDLATCSTVDGDSTIDGDTSTLSTCSRSWQQCCFFMDNLCRRYDLFSMCPSSISLIPPDIALACGIKSPAIAEHKRQSVAKFRAEVEQVQGLLADRQRQLEQLEQSHTYSPVDPNALDDYLKSLSVSLQTFSQLLEDFSHSYQSEIQPWTNRETPKLSSLGPCMKRVNMHMTVLNELLEGVAQLEEVFTALLKLPQLQQQTSHYHQQSRAHSLLQDCLSLISSSPHLPPTTS